MWCSTNSLVDLPAFQRQRSPMATGIGASFAITQGIRDSTKVVLLRFGRSTKLPIGMPGPNAFSSVVGWATSTPPKTMYNA